MSRMGLLGSLAMVALLAGCLLPPEAEYVPEAQNQPPRITLPSPPLEEFVVQASCGKQSYSVSVVDAEYDAIYWRAFVDYPRHPSQEFLSGVVLPSPEAAAGTRIYFEVNGDDLRFDGLTAVPHMVELMVSDRAFYLDERSPRNHAVPEDAGTDSVQWTVQYVQEASTCGE